MTAPPREPERRALDLARPLRARMLPLAVLLALTISLGAPLAFLAVGLHDLRHQAATSARGVAALIEGEVREDERLWRYNVPKLLGHLRTYQDHPDIGAVEVVDGRGRRVALDWRGAAPPLDRMGDLWASALIGDEQRSLGSVWVAVPTGGLYGEALAVLGLCALLGLGLAWLIYSQPVRTAARAEHTIADLVARLEDSRQELTTLNEELEQRVVKRSEQLSEAYEQLKAKESHLRQVSGQAVRLQELERRSIARELHDAVGQALTAVRINLQLIGPGGPQEQDAAQVATETMGLVDEALEEVRRAVASLGPAILDEIGLEAALARHCGDVAERTGIEVAVQVELAGRTLPPAVESTCYRVVQEGLTNVIRHAAAGLVTVRLQTADGRVMLEVRDDGQGLPPEVHHGAGRGLRGIRERATLLGGELEVESEPGAGTALRMTLPLSGDDSTVDPGAD